MKMIKKLINEHYLLILIVFGVLIAYYPIFDGFYQQDEWGTLGRYHLRETNLNEFLYGMFKPRTGHYVPLSRLLIITNISIFGLNYSGYVWVSLILHILVIILIYIFSYRLFGDKLLATASTSLFALNASIFQATSWIIVNISVHGAAIFGLISIIFFLKFIRDEHPRSFWLSLLSLIISLMFKETTIGLFGLLPVMYYIFKDFELRRQEIKYPLFIIISGILYLGFRVFLIASSSSIADHGLGVEQSNLEVIINLITFPISTLSQSVFYVQKIIILGKDLFPILPFTDSIEPNTTPYNLFIETEFVLGFSIIFFMFIVALLTYYWRQKQDIKYLKIAIFGLIFVLFNGFIYALSPARTGIISIMDSRNLYFPAVGAAIFIPAILQIVFNQDKDKLLLLIVPFVFINAIWLNEKVAQLSETGVSRKKILHQIKDKYPELPDKVVFYTESDSPYYGLPNSEKILPFQSGLGQTLLVWYSDTEDFSEEFYDNFYLWHIKSQDYMEIGGRGFGYYREFDKLKIIYLENELSPENVIAFSWSREDQKLRDITPEIRDRLEEL